MTDQQPVQNPATPREVERIQLYARLDHALAQIERGIRCLEIHYIDVNDPEDLRRWLQANRDASA